MKKHNSILMCVALVLTAFAAVWWGLIAWCIRGEIPMLEGELGVCMIYDSKGGTVVKELELPVEDALFQRLAEYVKDPASRIGVMTPVSYVPSLCVRFDGLDFNFIENAVVINGGGSQRERALTHMDRVMVAEVRKALAERGKYGKDLARTIEFLNHGE